MSDIKTVCKTIFSIFGLLFYTSTLKFDSLFSVYDHTKGTYILASQPLSPILSLTQHTIFLVALFFLFIRWKDALEAITRNIFLWSLVAVVLVSFLWSDFPDVTQPRSLSFLETSLFGLYFASCYELKVQVRLLACAIGISLLLNILFTVALPIYGIDWIIHPGAWKGVFVQKNILGRLVVLGCLAFLLVEIKHKVIKYLPLIFLSLSIGLIILSQSKSALLIFLIIVFLLFVLKTLSWSDIVAIPFLFSILLIIGSFLIIMITNFEKILLSLGRDSTLSGRTVIWSAILEKIQERPLLGYGYLGFWHNIYGDSADVGKALGNTYIPPHAHNGFLDLVLSFGWIGALFFGLSFFLVVRRAIIVVYWRSVTEELFPFLYLSFLVLYNSIEATLVEHNSIFWVLYVSLASTRFLTLDISEEDTVISNNNQKPSFILKE